jgi:hypothetical protein
MPSGKNGIQSTPGRMGADSRGVIQKLEARRGEASFTSLTDRLVVETVQLVLLARMRR